MIVLSAAQACERMAIESWELRMANEQAEDFPDLAPPRRRRTLRKSDERQT